MYYLGFERGVWKWKRTLKIPKYVGFRINFSGYRVPSWCVGVRRVQAWNIKCELLDFLTYASEHGKIKWRP